MNDGNGNRNARIEVLRKREAEIGAAIAAVWSKGWL